TVNSFTKVQHHQTLPNGLINLVKELTVTNPSNKLLSASICFQRKDLAEVTNKLRIKTKFDGKTTKDYSNNNDVKVFRFISQILSRAFSKKNWKIRLEYGDIVKLIPNDLLIGELKEYKLRDHLNTEKVLV